MWEDSSNFSHTTVSLRPVSPSWEANTDWFSTVYHGGLILQVWEPGAFINILGKCCQITVLVFSTWLAQTQNDRGGINEAKSICEILWNYTESTKSFVRTGRGKFWIDSIYFYLCTSITYGTCKRERQHLQNCWSHQFCIQRDLSIPSALSLLLPLSAGWSHAGVEQGHLVLGIWFNTTELEWLTKLTLFWPTISSIVSLGLLQWLNKALSLSPNESSLIEGTLLHFRVS